MVTAMHSSEAGIDFLVPRDISLILQVLICLDKAGRAQDHQLLLYYFSIKAIFTMCCQLLSEVEMLMVSSTWKLIIT